MIYWIFLALAIVAEVIGTLSMKYASMNSEITGHLVMYLMISLSYVLLALAVKRLSLGVAYAMWEGIGIIFITLFSVLWFEEVLSPLKVLGLFTLCAGILLVKNGTRKGRNKDTDNPNSSTKTGVTHVIS